MRKIFFGILGFLIIGTPLFAQEAVNKKELKELMGDSYMIEQDYDGSAKKYREVLENDPQDTKAMIALADVLSYQKKYDESISEYEQALKLLKAPEERSEVKKKLAGVYTWKRDYPKAEALYREVVGEKLNDEKSTVAFAEVSL